MLFIGYDAIVRLTDFTNWLDAIFILFRHSLDSIETFDLIHSPYSGNERSCSFRHLAMASTHNPGGFLFVYSALVIHLLQS